MKQYTVDNGYYYVATVDGHAVEEMRNYGSGNLVFVACVLKAKYARHGFKPFYSVFLKV